MARPVYILQLFALAAWLWLYVAVQAEPWLQVLGPVELNNVAQTDIEKADRLLTQAITPYSALRDSRAGEVRIFFDAEGWLADDIRQLTFVTDTPTESHSDSRDVACALDRLSDNQRRQSGYALTCKDPGRQYTHVIFGLPESLYWQPQILHALKIEDIEVQSAGLVGLCTAPLYARVPLFGDWVQNAQRMGVSRIYTYVASSSRPQFSRVLGVRHMKTNFTPFEPVDSPIVRYLQYQPYNHRFYFAQTTMLNECVYRTRHAHAYVVMADADEYLTVREPGGALPDMLHTAFQQPVASILLDVVRYPQSCQPSFNHASVVLEAPPGSSIAESCHLFDPTSMGYEYPKAIIMPNRTGFFLVHNMRSAKTGFRRHSVYPSHRMHFKHVRVSNVCTDQQMSRLVDDRNSTAFEGAVADNQKETWFTKEEPVSV